jgi:LuxR family transcriptional regulator, maltose regulon positive regulatory protein
MQILSTKLSYPRLRSRLVTRLRLVEKLNQGIECGFILLSAPAGYGKSTLLSSWLNQSKSPAVWLNLDDGDDDPARFLTYLAAAFNKLHELTDEPLRYDPYPSHLPDVEVLLTSWLNQLDRIKQSFWLVLDDYHVIKNQTVHQVISFLLEHRPKALHLAIATRADPPLALSRMRGRSQLVEVRLADLRFTDQEAAEFLAHTMGLQVTKEDAARMTNRTEGWIAGLQMAALSLQGVDKLPSEIHTVSGNQRYIFDYLLDEILTRQAPEIKQFLLYTSILDHLTGSLCDAVLRDGSDTTARPTSIVILEELERTNLFIMHLDADHHWYRYHALFAELLQGYLQEYEAHQIPILHSRASAWYERQGMIEKAIQHALLAGDGEQVLRLISANVFALLEQSGLNTVISQLDRLTGLEGQAYAWLWIGRAWLAAYTGQFASIDTFLKKAEASSNSVHGLVEKQSIHGNIAAIHAYTAWIAGETEIANQEAQAALSLLPPNDYLMRCQAATILGLSLTDLGEAAKAHLQALKYAQETGLSHITVFASACWAFVLVMQGRLREGYAVCEEIIRSAKASNLKQPLPTLSHVYSTMSKVLCEWNEVDNAVRYGEEAVLLASRWEQVDALHLAYTYLGEALFARGDIEGAFENLGQAWQVARRTSTWFEAISAAQEVKWYISLGYLDSAAQLLRNTDMDITASLSLDTAHLLIAKKQFTQAMLILAEFLDRYEKMEMGNACLQAIVLQSIAQLGMEQDKQAMISITQALKRAAPEGYVRLFIGTDPQVSPLLHQVRAEGILPEYVDKLLAASLQTVQPSQGDITTNLHMIEKLSVREIEVLKLLAQGKSDKEIAECLVIARETVHKHLKNIYGKLEVHSRSSAVVRAREIRLL